LGGFFEKNSFKGVRYYFEILKNYFNDFGGYHYRNALQINKIQSYFSLQKISQKQHNCKYNKQLEANENTKNSHFATHIIHTKPFATHIQPKMSHKQLNNQCSIVRKPVRTSQTANPKIQHR